MSPSPDLLNERTALFLDFDGTLAELAPRPDAVVVAPDLVALLGHLHQRLGGALALVTGRAQPDLDPLLAPLRLPAAFEHGGIRRTSEGTLVVAAQPDLEPVVAAVQPLLQRHPALVMERKHTALALHYRQAPELAGLCEATVRDALRHAPGLQMLCGKAVIEVKLARTDKGEAIAAFMAEPPFGGRQPVFVGDDTTDEAGFEAVQRLGGAGIKVGTGDSRARFRLADTTAVHEWLRNFALPSWHR